MEATPTPRTPGPAAPREEVGIAPVRPNGPVAAAVLAAGIGSLVLAILVVIAEASISFADSLAYSERVGPLAGKTIWAVVAYLGSWLVLGIALREREVDLRKVAIVAAILIALALIGTFAPFFQLFAAEE
jgi:hypothetical protein